MLSINIQYGNRSDLEQAREKLSPFQASQLLIQVFCGDPREQFISDLLADVTGVFPGAAVVGTTTAGEIINGESRERTTVINMTRFEKTEVCSALVDQNDNLFEAGLNLAGQVVRPDTQAAILFGCGIKNGGAINGEPLLAGFQQACPQVCIAGAQAGDNGLARQTFVFTQNGCTDKGAVAASLSGSSLIINNRYNLSWVPLGKSMEITRAEDTRIHTIDDKPAREIYAHYLGENVGDRLPHSAAEFPLVVERHGIPLARHANQVLPDGSLEFMAPFHSGEKVRFAFCHTGLISESAHKMFDACASRDCDAIFIYSCLSRKWVLGADCALEITPLSKLAPTAGFFSYGEYFQHAGQNLFLSQTMTVLALSEGGNRKKFWSSSATPEFAVEETKQVQDLQALHRLVETSAREREKLIEELQAALSEIKTLRGFIPICANCKSIRDDKGYWSAIEKYIQDRTDAQFSHGICPDCALELYPEIVGLNPGNMTPRPV